MVGSYVLQVFVISLKKSRAPPSGSRFKKERKTNLDERRHGKLFTAVSVLFVCLCFSFPSLFALTGGKLETHLDSYGSLANTSIAEDGDFEEHSC